jgi:hypothetical protein
MNKNSSILIWCLKEKPFFYFVKHPIKTIPGKGGGEDADAVKIYFSRLRQSAFQEGDSQNLLTGLDFFICSCRVFMVEEYLLDIFLKIIVNEALHFRI